MEFKIRLAILAVLVVILRLGEASLSIQPRLIDEIPVPVPGFVTFIPSDNRLIKYHLAISSFNGAPFSKDFVHYIANYTGVDGKSNLTELNNKNIIWPNDITFTNVSILSSSVDKYGGLIVPGGFLVPSKDNGAIHYYPFTSPDRSTFDSSQSPLELTQPGKLTWFYHRVRFVDLSGDGRLDILTCRTHKPVVGSTIVQLVGLVYDPKSSSYEEKLVLDAACDVFFETGDIDKDGRFEIIAAGYFISQLNVIYSDAPDNSFLNGMAKIRSLDSTGGQFFDIKIVDLDLDGNLDLLVTNHQGIKDEIKGSLYYYTINGGTFRNGTFTRNVIYDNFPATKSGIKSAAPGSAKPFYPLANVKGKRPYLLVAGDCAENLYIFEPNDYNPLSYTLIWTHDYEDTVGGITIADINQDGVNEFAVAVYEKNFVDVYTFDIKGLYN